MKIQCIHILNSSHVKDKGLLIITKIHYSQVFSVFSKQGCLFSCQRVFGQYHTCASNLIGVLFLLYSWQNQSGASNCLWSKIPTILVLSLRFLNFMIRVFSPLPNSTLKIPPQIASPTVMARQRRSPRKLLPQWPPPKARRSSMGHE